MAKSTDQNIIISPYSIASSAAFLAQGSNGNTFDQIVDTLRLPKDKPAVANLFHELAEDFGASKRTIELNVANRIYVQQGNKISSEFNEVASSKFNAGAEVVDFGDNIGAANTINRWVENKTHDRIKDLVKPEIITPDTALILVNAIYFKAFWDHSFYELRTAPGKFYTNEKDTVNVQYMNTKHGYGYAVLDDLDATALEMAYYHSPITFVVILPNKKTGLSELENKLKDYDMTKITGQLEKAEVNVTLPKFKIEYEVKLNDVLTKVCFLFQQSENE